MSIAIIWRIISVINFKPVKFSLKACIYCFSNSSRSAACKNCSLFCRSWAMCCSRASTLVNGLPNKPTHEIGKKKASNTMKAGGIPAYPLCQMRQSGCWRIYTTSCAKVGVVDVLENGGGFLLKEFRCINPRQALIQYFFNSHSHFSAGLLAFAPIQHQFFCLEGVQ